MRREETDLLRDNVGTLFLEEKVPDNRYRDSVGIFSGGADKSGGVPGLLICLIVNSLYK